jgi:protoheme IX farnesyltransferase
MTTAEYAQRTGCRNLPLSILLLCRPGILALVALAGVSGMVLAAGAMPGAEVFAPAMFCLLLSAAGSAVINSVLDYPLDLKMSRLQARVEALRCVGRIRAALLGSAMIIVSLAIASIRLNSLSVFLIFSAALTYTIPYTLWLKRCSPFGAIPGSIPGALPVLIGYAAVAGELNPGALLLFLIVFLWQPPHFWIFALKHRGDYLDSGVPVLSAVMGEATTRRFILAHSAALLPASTALGIFSSFSTWYMGAAVLSWLMFMAACYLFVVRRPLLDLAFKATILYLFFIFLAIIGEICIFSSPGAGG